MPKGRTSKETSPSEIGINTAGIILFTQTFSKPIPLRNASMQTLYDALPSIEDRLGYRFQDRSVLVQAFVHRSFLNESQLPNLIAYERLEFLGDAVLNLYVSAYLFSRFPDIFAGPPSK